MTNAQAAYAWLWLVSRLDDKPIFQKNWTTLQRVDEAIDAAESAAKKGLFKNYFM